MSNHINSVLLVGAGPMAISYAQVLKALGIPFSVAGRSEKSAAVFQEQTGIRVHTGGLEAFIQKNGSPSRAIVATGVEALEVNTLLLLESGCHDILVEKPGALNDSGIMKIADLSAQKKAQVYIAYNRRFYSSVNKAQQMIEEDGGLRDIYFEFTEWGHVIEPLEKAPGVKEHWFLANSTHVVDLAFHLAGWPDDWKCWTADGSTWHPAATRFAGSGITNKSVMFTYHADWEGPGRWGIELVTNKRRFYLRPLEQLFVQKKGSVSIEPVDLDDKADKEFKPGLKKQIESWLMGDPGMLCNINEQLHAMKYYYKMVGYK